jgi:hypothetical protein
MRRLTFGQLRVAEAIGNAASEAATGSHRRRSTTRFNVDLARSAVGRRNATLSRVGAARGNVKFRQRIGRFW